MSDMQREIRTEEREKTLPTHHQLEAFHIHEIARHEELRVTDRREDSQNQLLLTRVWWEGRGKEQRVGAAAWRGGAQQRLHIPSCLD